MSAKRRIIEGVSRDSEGRRCSPKPFLKFQRTSGRLISLWTSRIASFSFKLLMSLGSELGELSASRKADRLYWASALRA